MSEKCNLSWDTFREHLQLMSKELFFEEEKYSDVTLVCDDQTQFKAHKIVLSACSPVFKKIIDNNPSQNPLIYLRGIQGYEMESILQFMYLGEGRFYYERMGEFMKVAKDLEVREITKGVEMQLKKEDDTDNVEKENDEDIKISQKQSLDPISTDTMTTEKPKSGKVFSGENQILKHNGFKNESFNCDQCDYQAISSKILQKHIQSKHERRVYSCDTCDFQATRQHGLKRHVMSKHEGIRYPCNHCDYQATQKYILQRHIQSKHEDISFPCDQCDYQATNKYHLKKHIESIHEGIKYPCNHCDYQATEKSSLNRHIQGKHSDIILHCEHCNYETKWGPDLWTHKKKCIVIQDSIDA